MKRLLCFDMDNTIIDADKVHIEAYQKAVKEVGLKRVKIKRLRKLFGIVGKKLIKKLFPKAKKKQIAKLIEEHDEVIEKESKKYARAFPGVKGILRKLSKKYTMVLISNCRKNEIRAIMNGARVDMRMFRMVVGSDEVRNAKPAPDAVLLAKKKTGIKEGYMIGDTTYDIKAGKKAGMKTIGVLTGNHSRARLMTARPNFIIRNLKELPKILEDDKN